MVHLLGIKKVSDHATVPLRPAPNQDHEVFCSEDVVIPSHGTALVKTGLVLSVPCGTYVRIFPDVHHHAILGPVINRVFNISDTEELEIIVFNQSCVDVKIKRGDPVARIILVARAEVVEHQDITPCHGNAATITVVHQSTQIPTTPLEHPETIHYLYSINSHVVENLPCELRQWCRSQHKHTARIRSGDCKRLSSELVEWTVSGFNDAGICMWRKEALVKIPDGLVHPDTVDHLYNIRSPLVEYLPTELRQWCLAQDNRTVKISGGESMRYSPDMMEWTLTGYDTDRTMLWQKNVPVKMPYENAWSSMISETTDEKRIFTTTKKIFYVASHHRDKILNDSSAIWKVLTRLVNNVTLDMSYTLDMPYPNKETCLAIGGVHIPKSTVMAVKALIECTDAFQRLKGLPLYYVDINDTKNCVSAEDVVTAVSDTDYDTVIFT